MRGALAAVEVRALRRGHRAGAGRARERAGAAVTRAAGLAVATAGRVGRAAAAARAAQARGTLTRRRAADLAVAAAGLAAPTDAHRARAALVTGAARAAVTTAVHLRQRAHAALAEEIAAALGARATRRALERAASPSHAVRTATAVLGLLARDPCARHRAAQIRLAAAARRARPEITTARLADVATRRGGSHVGTEGVVSGERVVRLLRGVDALPRVAPIETAASIGASKPEGRDGDEEQHAK